MGRWSIGFGTGPVRWSAPLQRGTRRAEQPDRSDMIVTLVVLGLLLFLTSPCWLALLFPDGHV